MLIPFILTLSFDTSWIVNNSNSWISCVDMLSTSTWRPFRLDGDVFLINLKVSWNIWCYQDHTCWAMKSSSLLCFWNSLNFMYTWFIFHIFKHIFTFSIIECILTSFSNLHVFLEFLFTESPTFQLAEVLVHGEDLFCEETAFGTASSLHDFNGAGVLLIGFGYGQDLLNNLFLYFFNLSIVLIITFYSEYVFL